MANNVPRLTALALLLLSLLCANANHVYNHSFVPDASCPSFEEQTKPYSLEFITKLRLWPNLMSQFDLEHGESLYGSAELLELIWNNQNPEDCSTAKFVVSAGWPYGFGSRIHTEAIGLSIALQLGRVYMFHPDGDNIFWETDNDYCKDLGASPPRGDTTLACFYEQLSSRCSMHDAVRDQGDINKYPQVFTSEFKDSFDSKEGLEAMVGRLDRHTSVNLVWTYDNSPNPHNGYDTDLYIPHQARRVLECSPLKTHAKMHWWRGITATYIVRPNQFTLGMFQKHSDLEVADFNEAVGVFVRHGDKGIEMKLIDFLDYASTAQFMWKEGMLPLSRREVPADMHNYIDEIERRQSNLRQRQGHGEGQGEGGGDSEQSAEAAEAAVEAVEASLRNSFNGTLFITTEDQAVLDEASEWGRKNGWNIAFTTLFDRTQVTAAKTWDEMRAEKAARHDHYEYFSMLLNLKYSLQCEAWVCTLASNSCRLIDELRSTVGGKANRFFADLSAETCSDPPCFEEGIFKYTSRRRLRR